MRPVNLVIIAVSMFALRYLILTPLLLLKGVPLIISTFDFGILVFGTLLIAGAGNIINDYFDIRPDRLNKHHKVIVGKYIKRRVAMGSHVILSTIGFFLSAYVALKYSIPWMLLFQVLAITLLWFYSASFKKTFILGNLIVAFLTACIPLIVISFDIPAIYEVGNYSFPYFDAPFSNFKVVIVFTFVYAAFAFLLNLIREIVKDMADMRGDKEIDAQTMPLVLGLTTSKKIVNSLSLFTLLLLVYIQQTVQPDRITSIYLLLFIITPLILGIYHLKNAKNSKSFLRVSSYIKFTMAGGLAYLFLFNYLLSNHFIL
jgi:4-hydroxybenzoate polyprenyltransferase